MKNCIGNAKDSWKSCLVAIILVIGINCSVFARDLATLKGTVFDPDGATIPNAIVTVQWNDIGAEMSWNNTVTKPRTPHKKILSIMTDRTGSFSLDLTPGVWDIFVHADAIRPICRSIGLEAGKTETVELRMTQRVRRMQE